MATVADFIAGVESSIGTPYKWGGDQPGGFDCSGLVYYWAGQCGLTIPRTSQLQWTGLERVSAPIEGDLVFYNVPGDGSYQPAHVGMVLNATQMIDAPYTGTKVRIDPLNPAGWGTIEGYCRLNLPPAPQPSSISGGNMIDSTQSGEGYVEVKPNGNVYAYGDASYHGNPTLTPGSVAVGITLRTQNDGYWVMDSTGAVFSQGNAQYHGGYNQTP